MRIPVALICMLLLGGAASAQTDKDFDLACAITASAEMATTQKGTRELDAAVAVWTFYLGRLTARDDKTYWGAVIKGRIAELREQAKSQSLYHTCMDFYLLKMK
jgi:hypothetical protein